MGRGGVDFIAVNETHGMCCFEGDCLVVLLLCSGCFCGWFCAFPAPRCRAGAHALPLSGAGLTFFAAAKKVSKESGLTPPILARSRG